MGNVDSERNRENTAKVEDDQSVEYEKVLEEIGFGKAQWIQLLISGLLTITSVDVQAVMGIITIASQCEFEMSQRQKGVMMAACVTGIFLSTYIWGYLSDIIGRRVVLIYSTLVACGLQFFSVFITNVWFFNIINLLSGISLGGVSAALYPYLSEFNTAKHRVVVINFSLMFVSVAAIYIPATAWLVLSYDWSLDIGITIRPWRLLIILTFLPGLIGALWLFAFPESPKLLLAQEKEQAALDAIDWICKYNKGRPLASVLNRTSLKLRPEKISDDDVISHSKGCDFFILIWKATVPLFHRPHVRNVLISVSAVFLMFFGTNGIQAWYPEIVNRASSHVSIESATICEVLDASFAKQMANNMTEAVSTICVDEKISQTTYINTIINGCVSLVSFTVQGLLLNSLGRKNVLLGTLGVAILSVLLLQFVTNSTAILILFCLYMIMPRLSISTMLGAVVDLLPTSMRGKAVSICLTLGRLGIVMSANLVAIILEPMCIGAFTIFTISLLVAVVLVYFLPI